jgi:hypothetical protein
MKKTISAVTLLLAGLLAAGCTNPETAIRALEGAGYKDIQITSWAPWACSESDQFATGFEATGPTGKRVAGTVCSGILKGATIRTD